MDSQTLLSGLLTVAVGAISGGITNAVAIWMLFHPYEQRGRWPLRLHGAIPKNKARLAKSIGKTVGEKLLTPADLSLRLSAPEVRAAFDSALSGFLDEMLERERGPLVDLLPPEMSAELDRWIDQIGERVADDLAAYLAGPAFAAQAERWMAQWQAEYGDRPIGNRAAGQGRSAAHRPSAGRARRHRRSLHQRLPPGGHRADRRGALRPRVEGPDPRGPEDRVRPGRAGPPPPRAAPGEAGGDRPDIHATARRAGARGIRAVCGVALHP